VVAVTTKARDGDWRTVPALHLQSQLLRDPVVTGWSRMIWATMIFMTGMMLYTTTILTTTTIIRRRRIRFLTTMKRSRRRCTHLTTIATGKCSFSFCTAKNQQTRMPYVCADRQKTGIPIRTMIGRRCITSEPLPQQQHATNSPIRTPQQHVCSCQIIHYQENSNSSNNEHRRHFSGNRQYDCQIDAVAWMDVRSPVLQ